MFTTYGRPELLEIVEVDVPVPGPGELLVDVKACSVNFPDLPMIQGKYQFKLGLPFIPGNEISGVVTSMGEGVQGFAEGDRVIGSTVFFGGLAQKARLRAATTVAVPDRADLAEPPASSIRTARPITLCGTARTSRRASHSSCSGPPAPSAWQPSSLAP
jgi:NADPH:quinone reductase